VAAHLAILASASAFSPFLRAIVPVAPASPHPRKLLVWVLVGGGLVGQAAGIAIVAALQGLGQTHHRGSPHVGPCVDIAVGILGLVTAGVLVLRRRRRVCDPAGAQPGRPGGLWPLPRLLAKGSPSGMFVPGMILGFPGVYYLAALTDIAHGDPNWSGRIVLMITFRVVAFVLVWAPLVSFLIAPTKTRRSAPANAWLVAHLTEIGIVVSARVGVDENIRGVTALSGCLRTMCRRRSRPRIRPSVAARPRTWERSGTRLPRRRAPR
jgi:hypothetical protein